MLDLMNRVSFLPALAPQAARTASANGITVDTLGYNGVCFEVQAGVITDGTHVFKLQDSPDNSVWTDVAATYVQTPSGQTNQFTSSTTAGTIVKFGYLGVARYVRLVSTVSGQTSGGFYASVAALGLPINIPAT
ncbi:MAG: hypothetical protein AUG51_20575 [Acidobacteria bacterium 13_1_20CM_3_53_8]|nr:MAG: hypothetical protein AUG51_20575 [Acidobacteria bacterium 13_1_20CM_3_53_8]